MTTKLNAALGFPGAVGTRQTNGLQALTIASYTMKDGASYAIKARVLYNSVFAGVLYGGMYEIDATAAKIAAGAGILYVGNTTPTINPGWITQGVTCQLVLTGVNSEILTLQTVGKIGVVIDHFGVIGGLEYIP